MSTVIKVENISKQYRLGDIGTGSIRDDLNRWWHQVRGKEDPYLKIGETNDRSQKGNSDYVWALRDINFEVKQGEVLGIIGRNGAGKSTLLKILSKTTKPTTGNIKIKGRIASLLEVGTGFHPELSGRENIFLNGAILGMTKREIKSKFDEIVDFSGVERYIDTPVKRYSSGMYVRLAFAVAAHLEPEILIIDEVLAVGDAEFQKKCLGKMKDVSVNDGRTVLFVSHNMAAIKSLCTQSLLLVNGENHMSDLTDNVIQVYLKNQSIGLSAGYLYDEGHEVIGDSNVQLLKLIIVDDKLRETDDLRVSKKIGFLIEYRILSNLYRPDLSFLISDIVGTEILHSVFKTESYTEGVHKFVVWFNENFFNDIEYKFMIGITTSNPVHIHLQHEIKFKIEDDLGAVSRINNDYRGRYHGLIRPVLQWEKVDR
jgi:lipopolysaccharide transport system ATP-binding protein